MKLYIFIITLLLSINNLFAGGPTMPDKWRLPNENELSDKWRTGKYKNAQAIGDFNGDGLIEGAFLAVSKDGKSEGLLAFIYMNNKEKWFVLDRSEVNKTVFMGLDLYKPGKYKVLCVTDEECKQGYKKEITIKNDSFSYYRPESASSIFIWNNSSGSFERIWESD